MLKSLILFLFIPATVLAGPAKRPNDSCAMGFSSGGDSFWRCDNGYFQTSFHDSKPKKISDKTFSQKGESLILKSREEFFNTKNLSADVKVPNDSCATSIYFGADRILRCEQGYFKSNKSGGFNHFDPNEWNKLLGSVISSEKLNKKNDSKAVMISCKKTGRITVECDDGEYKKTDSFDGELVKKVQERERRIRERRIIRASEE